MVSLDTLLALTGCILGGACSPSRGGHERSTGRSLVGKAGGFSVMLFLDELVSEVRL